MGFRLQGRIRRNLHPSLSPEKLRKRRRGLDDNSEAPQKRKRERKQRQGHSAPGSASRAAAPPSRKWRAHGNGPPGAGGGSAQAPRPRRLFRRPGVAASLRGPALQPRGLGSFPGSEPVAVVAASPAVSLRRGRFGGVGCLCKVLGDGVAVSG